MASTAKIQEAADSFRTELNWMRDLSRGQAHSVGSLNIQGKEIQQHFATLSKAFETLKQAKGSQALDLHMSRDRIRALQTAIRDLGEEVAAIPAKGNLAPGDQKALFRNVVRDLSVAFESRDRTTYGTTEL